MYHLEFECVSECVSAEGCVHAVCTSAPAYTALHVISVYVSVWD